MSTHPIQTQQAIRQHFRKLRKSLPPESQQQHADNALMHFIDWQNTQKTPAQPSIKIAVFLSQDGELSTQNLIDWLWQQPQFEVYLPIIFEDATIPMQFGRYRPDAQMELSHFKMMQPKETPTQQRIKGDDLDWVITPLVAFDAQGFRVGMGGGFYDRAFAFKKDSGSPLLIGWAHTIQQTEMMTHNSWDIPLDYLICETGWQTFSPAGKV